MDSKIKEEGLSLYDVSCFSKLYSKSFPFLGTVISMCLIDRIGRKPLLMLSGIGMGISHALIAWSFYNTEHQIQQNISITQNSSEMAEYKNLTYFSHADAKQMERDNATTYLPLIGVVCFFREYPAVRPQCFQSRFQ